MEHTLTKFPYDSKWTAKEIIDKLFSHLHELIPEYGEYCQNKVNWNLQPPFFQFYNTG